jgi:ribonuclease HII
MKNFPINPEIETAYEQKGVSFIIGCDEVGRGCLAGPVVAASVVMAKNSALGQSSQNLLNQINDSKLLSATKRQELSTWIKNNSAWAIAEITPQIIDEINILQASLLAMQKSVEMLHAKLENTKIENSILLIDGKFKLPNYKHPQEAIIKGDSKVVAIAAASIIAKVYRDDLMTELDKQYPNYGLSVHKGYPTKQHREAIKLHGITTIHRKSFNLL